MNVAEDVYQTETEIKPLTANDFHRFSDDQEWDARGWKEKFFELFSFPIREML